MNNTVFIIVGREYDDKWIVKVHADRGNADREVYRLNEPHRLGESDEYFNVTDFVVHDE